MKKRIKKYLEMFISYMVKTYKNKIWTIAIIVLGVLTCHILDDCTFLVFMILIGVPLFFDKKDRVL